MIWETGTVDAVRGIDVDQFAAALQEGIAALRQHNFDIMLVNMQYNPNTGSVIDFEPYLEALQPRRRSRRCLSVPALRDHAVLERSGRVRFVDVPRERRRQLAAEVYRCIGETLAEAIDYGAR